MEAEIKEGVEPKSYTKCDNLTREQRVALNNLKHNNIIINKADKGSTIVVQDKLDYIKDDLSHLNDPTTYRKVNKNTTEDTKKEINKLLDNINNSKLMNWLMAWSNSVPHQTTTEHPNCTS